MMNGVAIKPSKKLRTLVSLFNSPNAAADAWEVNYGTLVAFLEGKGSLPGNTVAQIIVRTGLPYDELFEHEEARR